MSNFLFLDFETTSSELDLATPIEFGYVRTDSTLRVLDSGSFLINSTDAIPEEITRITKLTLPYIQTYGVSCEEATARIKKAVESADVLVAHNGLRFDFPLLKKVLGDSSLEGKILFDTMAHFPKSVYDALDRKGLKDMCLEHMVCLPTTHSAIQDVQLMLGLVQRLKGHLTECLENTKISIKKYRVDVTFDEKQKAKDIGAIWNGNLKRWEVFLSDTDVASHREQGLKLLPLAS